MILGTSVQQMKLLNFIFWSNFYKNMQDLKSRHVLLFSYDCRHLLFLNSWQENGGHFSSRECDVHGLVLGEVLSGGVQEDNYCKYDNQMLLLFTPSLFLACLPASFAASMGGRWRCCWHLSCVVLNAAPLNLMTILIFGRLLIGTRDFFFCTH